MKLRYLAEYSKVLAIHVKEYADKNDVSLREARDKLVNETKPRLQYFDGGEWHDVETEWVAR